MQLDVVTLFPEWFDWFRSQRHVAQRARGTATSCAAFNPRDHTPLSGGQVDDTPFGGGAGMVLRVDVMDTALRAHLRRGPGRPAHAAARHRADARRPDARRRATSTSSPPSRRSRCCAAATRASTSASSSTSPPTRCRSAATCSRGGELAAMVVMDAVLRKLPGALGPRRVARWRSPSARRWAATPSTRTTRGRPSTAAGRCPTCCCPATTRRSARGAACAAASAGRG